MNHKLIVASAVAGTLLVGIGAGSTANRTASAGRQGAVVTRQVAASARAQRAKAAVLALLRGEYAAGKRAHRRATAGPNGVTNVFYFNWSGYAATGSSGTFTKVSGSWTVSKLPTCSAEHQTDSEWIGLDGFTNPSVEQAGTVAECYKGTADYVDWYEMAPTQPVVTVEHPVSPGDKVRATVTRKGSKYTLAVTDSTHPAASFSATATCTTCLNDSADWINERDFFTKGGYSPLAHYGTWKLTQGTATAAGKSASIGAQAKVFNIAMVDATDAYYLARASSLSGGNSFTTTWKDSW